jgi:hypothetical protein
LSPFSNLLFDGSYTKKHRSNPSETVFLISHEILVKPINVLQVFPDITGYEEVAFYGMDFREIPLVSQGKIET